MLKTKELEELVYKIVNNSDGRIRIALNEEDESTKKDLEAAHFLKLDEKRFGRDLELYEFMARVGSWDQALTDILDEIILPLKQIGNIYEKIKDDFINWGLTIYPQNLHQQWKELFA